MGWHASEVECNPLASGKVVAASSNLALAGFLFGPT